MLYTPGRVTHANANIILDDWYFSKKSNSRTFEEIQTNQQEIYEICKLLGHLNISRKSIFRKSENHWSYMYVVFRKKYFLWPISESELQRGFFMIPLEGFGPVVTFCSFVVMITDQSCLGQSCYWGYLGLLCGFEVKGAVFVMVLEKCEAPDIPRTSWDMLRSDMTVVHNSPPHPHLYANTDKNLPHGLKILRRFW